MTPKLAEPAVKLMVGKWFKYHKEELFIKGYEIKDVHLKLRTDKRDVTIHENDISPILDAFVLIPEPTSVIPLRESAVKSISGVTELKDILLDNIKKVQTSKEYIPQAQAVNDSVKTIIELAKAEIESIKLGVIINREP
jgi:hypothetical protein